MTWNFLGGHNGISCPRMEFLLWDPSCKSKQTLSPVSLPLALKWMGEGTELGSSWALRQQFADLK